MSREMALMMLLLLPKQVVGFFPFLKQMEKFRMFTYDCMEQKRLILWSRVAFLRCWLLSSNVLRTPDFGIREDPVSKRATLSSYPEVLRTALKPTSPQRLAVPSSCPDERPGATGTWGP